MNLYQEVDLKHFLFKEVVNISIYYKSIGLKEKFQAIPFFSFTFFEFEYRKVSIYCLYKHKYPVKFMNYLFYNAWYGKDSSIGTVKMVYLSFEYGLHTLAIYNN